VVACLSVTLASAAAGTLPDRDTDGLPDAWERHGVTVDGQFVDLPEMGADPDHPDLFVHVDWMVDETHDQRPDPAAIARVVEAFAAAPWQSPTGSVGITLHVDAGPASPMRAPDVRWGALSRARALPWRDNLGSVRDGTYDWSDFQAIKDEPGGFTASGRGPVFHYVVFGHYHDRDDARGSGASGVSRGIGGTDCLVTLGNFTRGVGSVQEQAGTLMHELGHNLGLRHGGDDDTNFKPGYVSVMSYAFQMDGLARGGARGIVDYSRPLHRTIDEALAEPTSGLLGAGGPWPPDDACVATGEVRAGMPVRLVAASSVGCPECDPGDDWRRVRLAVGSIGRTAGARVGKSPAERPAARAASSPR
jgi:hypothetical protein